MLHKWYETNDLPFDQDAAYKYVPWIIGLMVYLAILALAGSNLISAQLDNWEKSFTKGFTVEVPVTISATDPAGARQAFETGLLDRLQNIAGVEGAQVIAKSSLSPFSDPFGAGEGSSLLVDVKMRDAYDVNLAQAKAELQGYEGAILRDHREWRQSTLNFAYTAIFTGILIACMIGIAAVATIIFVTRTGLQVHQKTIEVMHLVGAQHRYIAQQFQHYAYQLAKRGGIIGLSLILLCLCFLAMFLGLQPMVSYLMETANLSLFLILGCTPLVAIMLTVLSAHVTVLSTLTKTSSW
jgi:cell division transport system permease protein